MLLSLCFEVYKSKDKIEEYNQDIMDLRVFRMKCDHATFADFYTDYIARNVPQTL